MNGAVYISFFQGQLESVLEQVVQLAVQELSKTVGSSLNGLLLETAVKEQENRRLRLQVQQAQARESDGTGPQGASGPPKKKASDERHEPRAHSSERGFGGTDTRRLEQRGRVVDQLKGVMQRVLDFAVGELTKIVEASFDDLLLEIVKIEREQQSLEERLELGASSGTTRTHPPTRRRGSENDSVSPSGSEDNREEGAEKGPHNHGEAHQQYARLMERGMAATSLSVCPRADPRNHAERRPTDLSTAQDWVPILDKVFGQKWCGDWSSERLEGGGPQSGENQGTGLMEPRPSSPQQDPRWTPLEDMEVFSPDEDEDSVTTARAVPPLTTTTTTLTSTGPSPTVPPGGPSLAPPGVSSRRSSASMLHRLLTLPSQLLEEDDRDDNNDIETLVVSMTTGDTVVAAETVRALSPPVTRDEDEDDEEEEEEEGDKRKKKRRRVWTECEDCGRRFSRVSLLKAHRQTHVEASPPAASDRPGDHTSALSCSDCGKRFSSNTRLQSHVRTTHGEKHA